MKRIFEGFWRAAKEGAKEGATKNESEYKADWQVDFEKLANNVANSSVPDQDVVNDYFDFISRHHEQKHLEKVTNLLDRIMSERPNTISMIREKAKQARESNQ